MICLVKDIADWRRNEVYASERLLRQLRPMREIAEPDVVFDTQVLEVEYLRRQGKLAMAFDKVQELFNGTRNCDSSGELTLCSECILSSLLHA